MKNNTVVSYIKGGFGNQLFQYATGLAVSMRNKASFKVDLSFFHNTEFQYAFRLDYLNIPYSVANTEDYTVLKNTEGPVPFFYRILNRLKIHNRFNKRTHIIDTASFLPSKNIMHAVAPAYIEGWCVKDVYFKNIRNRLLEIYTPKSAFSDAAKVILKKITNCNSVSLHFRRGDYLNSSVFENLTLEFYYQAMQKMNKMVKEPVFFVFSDDIAWVKTNLNAKGNIHFVDLSEDQTYSGKADVEEFFLMKNCRHNIISNSSFSWWAAYLNVFPEKKVIVPKKWYKDLFYQNSLEQYSFMPEDWILL